MVYLNINNMAWNKDYQKQGNWQKDKPVYKPKRGPLKPLMTEEEKSSAKVEDLAYDFACRITRLFQYLTEDAEYKEYIISKQIFRSGTSIGANLKAAIKRVQCPNSFEHSFSRAKLLVKASPARGCRAAEREQARRSQ